MAALTWDATGTRFYEMGVSKGILFVQNADGTYQKGVPWNGLTSVSESPEGAEANDLWADNIKYASLRSAETFGGTIEAYTYPDEWCVCDGLGVPANGLRVGQQKRSAFALCYRTEVGNDVSNEAGYIIHLVYNATASPSERQYETINDSPDAITMSWEFDTTPIAVNGYKPTSTMSIDSTKCDAGTLTALEAILYGSVSDDSRLPLPDEIISLFGGSGMIVTPSTVTMEADAYSPNLTVSGATGAVSVDHVYSGETGTTTSSAVTAIISGDNDTVILHTEAAATAGKYRVILKDSASTPNTATITVTVTE